MVLSLDPAAFLKPIMASINSLLRSICCLSKSLRSFKFCFNSFVRDTIPSFFSPVGSPFDMSLVLLFRMSICSFNKFLVSSNCLLASTSSLSRFIMSLVLFSVTAATLPFSKVSVICFESLSST